jgi:hypothetical protein
MHLHSPSFPNDALIKLSWGLPRGWIVLSLSVVLFSCASKPETAKSPQQESPKQQSKVSANFQGFRSARFGMSEPEVISAVMRDFNLARSEIFRQVHPSQKTVILSIRVESVAAHPGPAKVFYIFGYRSQKLMQVNVLWGKAVTDHPDGPGLVKIANELRKGFLKQSFKKEGLLVNRQISEGIFLVFQGVHENGQGVEVFLINPKTPGKGPGKEITLRLSYIARPGIPDVFGVRRGKS